MKKDLVSIADLTAQDFWTLLDTASRLKAEQKAGRARPLLAGKVLGMIFQKPSLRTRVSFEVGMRQLGGHAMYLAPDEIQLGRRESVPDAARVLSRFVDGIMIRTFAHREVEVLAEYASVPVINGLSDFSHPCQALADMLTVHEKRGQLRGARMAYVGDGNNVAHSLLLAAGLAGVDLAVASPPGYECDPGVVAKAQAAARASDCDIRLLADPMEAVRGADVIYTDVWVSMGQEAQQQQRTHVFEPYRVDARLVSAASPDVLVMHCLPAHRGEEIDDEVLDGPHSVVYDQAENRLHAQKAVLALLMGDGNAIL